MGIGSTHFPVIVIGGGTMGTGAAWALAKRGFPALVLEQFGHVHDQGSHSGRTRIIRHAYAESPDYVPLVRYADELWQELEAVTGETLLRRTGGLDLAAPGYGHARAARRSCDEWGIPYEWLDGAEVRRRWPSFVIPDEWEACFSPLSGYLLVEPALRAMAAAARASGVTIKEHEPVLGWSTHGGGVRVVTARATYTADRLIVTAGAWANGMLAGRGLPLTVLRKTLFWFAVDDPAPFHRDRFPVFISESRFGSMYAFPVGDEAGLKAADHAGGTPADPDSLDRTVADGEEHDVVRFVQQHLRGVSSRVIDRAACMYTMTPDEDFIVDRLPDLPQVAVGAGFSGHGFKFTPAIGEELANLVLDPTAASLPRLRLDRFAPAVV